MKRTTLRVPRTLAALGVLLAATTLAGCWTLSLHPLYTDDTLVFVPELEGLWGDPEDTDGERWHFAAAGTTSYRVTLHEGGSAFVNPAAKPTFRARLLHLGSSLYLDLFPETPEGLDEYYESHVIEAHSFARLRLEDDALFLAFLDAEWLEEQLDAGKVRLDHVRRGNEIILTAPPAALQSFVRTHGEEAFDEDEPMHRIG